MMTIMMMIMTDPFTTNLVVKGPVVKGSVVKGATSVVNAIMMTIMMTIMGTVVNVMISRWFSSHCFVLSFLKNQRVQAF